MYIVKTGDPRVGRIIGQELRADKQYRLSDYTISFSDEGVHLILSTLTGVIASFSDAEWVYVMNMKDHLISGLQLKGAGFEELAQNCFFIEESQNDYTRYQFVLSVLNTMSREKKGTKTYTILPTTGCNARCVYCYEEGMPVRTMTEDTADRVVEFIDKTRWQDEIKLIWFGGEPLLASRIISRICNGLSNRNIPFRSSLVTNACLLTPLLLEEAVTLWHLKTAQVSVDGKQEDYETRKKYYNPATHHYHAMMAAVGSMLEHGIQVTLRCNYDEGNISGLKEFFDHVKTRFGTTENLSVYPAMLFQAKREASCVELYQRERTLRAYLRELGLYGKEEHAYKMKLNLCGADSGDKCTVIDPEGNLYHCEHLPGNTAFGNIFDSVSSAQSNLREDILADHGCRRCPYLPKCTPFFRSGCPDWFTYCREFRQLEAEDAFRLLSEENEVLLNKGKSGASV